MQRNLINGVLLGKKIGFGSFVKDDNQNKKFMISKNFNKRSFLVAYRLINLAKLHRYALTRNKCESDRIDEINKISPVPDWWAEDIDLTLITVAFLKRKLLVQWLISRKNCLRKLRYSVQYNWVQFSSFFHNATLSSVRFHPGFLDTYL